MADKKQRYAIINYFKKTAKEYGIPIKPINIHSQQWAAEAMIESYGYDECLSIIDYYFYITETPDWSWLTYNSEKLVQSKLAEEEDREMRRVLRQKAKKWLED